MPPDLSVVVATHDRAGRLGELLDSLANQTLAPDRFEVVVVDDGSRDDTPAVLAGASARLPVPLRVIRRESAAGPSVARNEGWRAARAPLVAFTDDDCVVAPGWAEAGLRALADAPGAIVQGRTDPRPDELGEMGPFSRTLRVDSAGPWFQTCNVFYPRDLLERVGGFDAQAFRLRGEDADLAWRAIATGARAVFAPDAQAFHAVADLGPIGKLRVAARWTEAVRTIARHPELRRAQLTYGVFWKGSHYLLARALVAAVLPRRRRFLRRWLAWPYVAHLLERGRIEGGGPLAAPYFALHDVVEAAAVVHGGVRCRTIVF